MAFNRYAILTNYYTQEISNWRWNIIEKSLTDYEPEGFNPEYDSPLEGVCVGTQLGMFPSGKIYTFWTTNQTRADVIRDECFSDALEAVAHEKSFYVDYFDGCVFLVREKKENSHETV